MRIWLSFANFSSLIYILPSNGIKRWTTNWLPSSRTRNLLQRSIFWKHQILNDRGSLSLSWRASRRLNVTCDLWQSMERLANSTKIGESGDPSRSHTSHAVNRSRKRSSLFTKVEVRKRANSIRAKWRLSFTKKKKTTIHFYLLIEPSRNRQDWNSRAACCARLCLTSVSW